VNLQPFGVIFYFCSDGEPNLAHLSMYFTTEPHTGLGFLKEKKKKSRLKNSSLSQVPVAHACNPSNSGGRDEEDCGLKPTWANSLRDPVSKNTQPKKGWWSDLCGRAPA
jgi:hypothetical protein